MSDPMVARQPLQPVGHAGDGSLLHAAFTRRLDRIAAQVEMRRAIARTRPAGMTAESDRLALLIAAIRIAAIAALQLDQGEMPRLDRCAAQVNRPDLLERR